MAYHNQRGRTLIAVRRRTFEQFEALLRLFEKLDNEENEAWWEKLANDIERTYHRHLRKRLRGNI